MLTNVQCLAAPNIVYIARRILKSEWRAFFFCFITKIETKGALVFIVMGILRFILHIISAKMFYSHSIQNDLDTVIICLGVIV